MNSSVTFTKVGQLMKNKKYLQQSDSENQEKSITNQQNGRGLRQQKEPLLENSLININLKQINNHTKITFQNNIDVYFPYKPYEVQEVFMDNVIKCLQKRQNGLLESPTGTGKTLSLLCASLGWLQARRKVLHGSKEQTPNRIIYCSRTHSQIQQVVKELKRTIYEPKMVIQGSREQYCLKKYFEQLKGEALNTQCMKATSSVKKLFNKLILHKNF